MKDGQRVVVRGSHHGVLKGDPVDGRVFVRFDSGNSGVFSLADVAVEEAEQTVRPRQDKSLRPREQKG